MTAFCISCPGETLPNNTDNALLGLEPMGITTTVLVRISISVAMKNRALTVQILPIQIDKEVDSRVDEKPPYASSTAIEIAHPHWAVICSLYY